MDREHASHQKVDRNQDTNCVASDKATETYERTLRCFFTSSRDPGRPPLIQILAKSRTASAYGLRGPTATHGSMPTGKYDAQGGATVIFPSNKTGVKGPKTTEIFRPNSNVKTALMNTQRPPINTGKEGTARVHFDESVYTNRDHEENQRPQKRLKWSLQKSPHTGRGKKSNISPLEGDVSEHLGARRVQVKKSPKAGSRAVQRVQDAIDRLRNEISALKKSNSVLEEKLEALKTENTNFFFCRKAQDAGPAQELSRPTSSMAKRDPTLPLPLLSNLQAILTRNGEHSAEFPRLAPVPRSFPTVEHRSTVNAYTLHQQARQRAHQNKKDQVLQQLIPILQMKGPAPSGGPARDLFASPGELAMLCCLVLVALS